MPPTEHTAVADLPFGEQQELVVVRKRSAARSLLDPLRQSILELLGDPGSSSTVAEVLGLPRQRVNYHVRELESDGLLRHVEDRRRGNCVERIVQTSARRFLVDPGLLGAVPTDDFGPESPFSSAALLSSATRTLSEVGALHSSQDVEGHRVPALSLDFRIRFRSPRDEVEFAQVIERVLQRLVHRYHSASAPGGRTFRITVGGHPEPAPRGEQP